MDGIFPIKMLMSLLIMIINGMWNLGLHANSKNPTKNAGYMQIGLIYAEDMESPMVTVSIMIFHIE